MSHPPTLVFQGASMDEETGPATQLKYSTKSQISRSNSAPQAHNRFSLTKGSSKTSSPKKQQAKTTIGPSPLATLSDGVVEVDHNQAAQAAASVIAASQQQRGDGDGQEGAVSAVPLCDANHSPSTTKRYYNHHTTASFSSNPQPDDVWQPRDQYNSSSPSHSQEEFSPAMNNTQHSSSKHSNLMSNGKDETNLSLCSDVANGENHSNSINTSSPTESHGNSEMLEPDVLRPQPAQRRQVRQAHSEVILPSEMQRKMSLANVKEKGYARLEEELSKAQKALEMKDEEVDELRGIRERLMKEVSDFTASLFEEVNSQLNEAALSEQQARKQLHEANHKIEMLSAEVAALKNLVLTSTPSAPNKHLHPQINNGASAVSSSSGSGKKEKGGKPFWMTHRRSTSHHQYTKEARERDEASQHHSQLKEMDTVAYDEFSRWRLQPTMEMSSAYFTRVQTEDIQPCLHFKNTRLADKLQQSVRENTLSIEPIPGDQSYPRKCCLSETHKLCNYKIKFEGDNQWYSISQMSRNRIAAVCDFYCYVRYIVQGLVKCADKDMFAELVRLRHRMAQARLGLI
ncbi:rab-3A-interacting protein [Elysia marginata]|uniref:Rab-3A-interacting protein n=1 Tax=Elysia marginata TaxID=1093978 RepID=A0AAV4JA18_9GAST|nr:rab-3A-interacting protein [Elysia marginata]